MSQISSKLIDRILLVLIQLDCIFTFETFHKNYFDSRDDFNYFTPNEIDDDFITKFDLLESYPSIERYQSSDLNHNQIDHQHHHQQLNSLSAIRSRHFFESREIDTETEPNRSPSRIIEIDGGSIPLELHFKSSSSAIKIKQSHSERPFGEGPEFHEHNEPPQLWVTEVRKPIIQEVREIIAPYRKVIQQIEPVIEEIHTIISKAEQSDDFKRTSNQNYHPNNANIIQKDHFVMDQFHQNRLNNFRRY
ncbi:hypothetical protein SSS_01529 [Sarcoptes scabiei]|uniref:Uncharacterized protein n=1 Tax=Sarcoptes scabiei TaxID=52283 RepID=A0A834VD90_SARSC|nr:hypothetical protein SSS_01529 [Sarcoptes scabiei]